MATSTLVQPGPDAGTLIIPSLGKTIKLVEWREDDFVDTVQTDASPTSGAQYEFFRDLAGKNVQHCNLKTPRKIPSGSELILTRIGLLVHQGFGNTLVTDSDTVKLAYNASLTFKINDRLISEGIAVKYQSGYGVTGSTTRTSTGMVTLGVPSAAAAPSLLVAQSVKDDDDLVSTLDFKSNGWLAGGAAMPTFTQGMVVSLLLHGLIKKPQGK